MFVEFHVQESSKPLTEDTYRAQVCLLNAALLLQLQGAFHFFEANRAKQCFARFDALLLESGKLQQTSALKEFHGFAKSAFYFRLGDVHLVNLLKSVSPPLCCL